MKHESVSKAEAKQKTIAILTSGGDAPGMNGAIRAVTRAGINAGYNILGVRRGFHGLWRGDIINLDSRSVSDILHRGGTFLMTARSETFKTEEGLGKAVDITEIFNIDVLVAIGGDGTARGAKALAEAGVPVIVIPATIDNDIGATEYALGFDTALNTAVQAIDKLRDTASSHERCSVVEVMGRHSGYIALGVGVASGAEVILVPEREFDFDDDIVLTLIKDRNAGKRHYIVVMAEGVGLGSDMAQLIEKRTGIETRSTQLGYLQRGGAPSFRDRWISSLMGVKAVRAISEGRLNRMIVHKEGDCKDIDLDEALATEKRILDDTINMADTITI
ncbi:MAG: ATP-dependent 6-phosphofructokinase [Eubacteriales bacterium]|nr:ATP-dependent 6-phosphofructokinase [Eubacteriales bacterium]MDD4323962.1 ATP-dependent 6-phosphofructokinase [Eubacteriales bacterium]MDD4540682.1 ATP-dependent 6-phosphofructokinase [Eubacteriales bacterium]